MTSQALRQFVSTRAQGRCEDNLALCCVFCNRYKGPNLATLDPASGELTGFFHPRKHRWEEHFKLAGGQIIGLTPGGRATALIFRFNDEVRVKERLSLMRRGWYL